MKYQVIMTYGEVQTISQEQYDKLVKVLLTENVSFVKINKILVQFKDIRMIKPIKNAGYLDAEAEAKLLEWESQKKSLSIKRM